MVLKIQNTVPKYFKTITHYKNSTWYLKRRTSNNKRVAKLIVYNSGIKKGNYEFFSFSGNGSRVRVYYDSRRGIRSVFFQKSKHDKEVLQSVLRRGVQKPVEWFLDTYNAAGEFMYRMIEK